MRGFVGGRIDLIPHQLYIAQEVANRQAPRVMLSDEVGLGKTIEACLILHRLLLSGRANRILVLVPESLVHQWFVEIAAPLQCLAAHLRCGTLRRHRSRRTGRQSISGRPTGADEH